MEKIATESLQGVVRNEGGKRRGKNLFISTLKGKTNVNKPGGRRVKKKVAMEIGRLEGGGGSPLHLGEGKRGGAARDPCWGNEKPWRRRMEGGRKEKKGLLRPNFQQKKGRKAPEKIRKDYDRKSTDRGGKRGERPRHSIQGMRAKPQGEKLVVDRPRTKQAWGEAQKDSHVRNRHPKTGSKEAAERGN